MPAKKQKTVRIIAAELGMSLGQINEAKKAGIDAHDIKGLRKFKAGIPPRVDARSEYSQPSKQPDEMAGEMTIEEIESALRSKAIDITTAKRLKTQLDGLKAAMAYRKETNELISRDEVRASFAKIAISMNAALRVAEAEIPQKCNGLPLAESRPITKEIMRGLQTKLADAESEFWTEYPELK